MDDGPARCGHCGRTSHGMACCGMLEPRCTVDHHGDNQAAHADEARKVRHLPGTQHGPTPPRRPVRRIDPKGNRMRKTLALAALLVALSGCAAPSKPTPAPTASCAAVRTEELYAQTRHDCPDGTRVYTFANEDARDGWTGAATTFGTVVLDKGEWWVKVDAK